MSSWTNSVHRFHIQEITCRHIFIFFDEQLTLFPLNIKMQWGNNLAPFNCTTVLAIQSYSEKKIVLLLGKYSKINSPCNNLTTFWCHSDSDVMLFSPMIMSRPIMKKSLPTLWIFQTFLVLSDFILIKPVYLIREMRTSGFSSNTGY